MAADQWKRQCTLSRCRRHNSAVFAVLVSRTKGIAQDHHDGSCEAWPLTLLEDGTEEGGGKGIVARPVSSSPVHMYVRTFTKHCELHHRVDAGGAQPSKPPQPLVCAAPARQTVAGWLADLPMWPSLAVPAFGWHVFPSLWRFFVVASLFTMGVISRTKM
ncbi:hypothetical protein E2C01_014764 [Portunus trituberculatus]|uniref:Uncharacterized protein n=1 Tax=Portunus trituberculatus TaxID=210409 RepID=A0A5B7DJY9_PORTR|nr:hypothetical protein [Portunus trituberculatus]